MCSIIGSFDDEVLKELIEKTIDAGLGCHSFSITQIDPKTSRVAGDIIRIQDEFDFKVLKNLVDETKLFVEEGYTEPYYIVHIQAPTSASTAIHPAQIDYSLLWHNGILKPETIEDLQSKYNMPGENWDTKLLLRHLLETNLPEDIDGSFACLFYNGVALRAFRNEIAPLYIDDKLTVCSLPFKNSKPLEPNTLFHFDLKKRGVVPMTHFKTVENPYWMPE